MKKQISLLALVSLLSLSNTSLADVTYDVTGSSGTRDGESFSEVHLGLNWHVSDWFNWRNSVFTQFGSKMKTVNGLDSAALFNFQAYTEGRGLGIEFFAGPGVRLASEKSNAAFGKAGVTFALAGIRLGGGVQTFHYLEDRVDEDGNTLNKDETQTFITISGGGSF
ncbi:hypothetical protein [Bdellovibrio reynosensis]|uniref:Outer membrane protein beta-barrel domain-containing protein n=1 Tax=Bdellovibrio reynosensis TaxID=2835041 RepID=A0ABY4CBA7_9BACT|nr:hypothetical protein [Bdellovibrio reynosensis]UOF01172.1 hypothetical protein MNR06_15845 [Bdellovibrio reynosensis]